MYNYSILLPRDGILHDIQLSYISSSLQFKDSLIDSVLILTRNKDLNDH